MDSRRTSRRRALEIAGTAGLIGLAGCSQYIPGGENQIKDTDGDGVIDSQDYAPRDPSVQSKSDLHESTSTPTQTTESSPTTTRTTTTQVNTSKTAFYDDFDNGVYDRVWEFANGSKPSKVAVAESGSVLRHRAPYSYSSSRGNLRTRNRFEAAGNVKITVRMRTRTKDYWGYGFAVRFETGGLTLKNHKWEGFDRFAAFGVEDRPDKYASDYHQYGEQTHKAKFGPATSSTRQIVYSMTIDTDAGRLIRVRRGRSTYNTSLDIGDVSGPFHVTLSCGGGHDVEYDFVKVEGV